MPMKNKIEKTMDFYMATAIFVLAILEFTSWIYWSLDKYSGPVMASEYFLDKYPKFSTGGYLVIALYFFLKSIKFRVCIYTKIVSWVFLFIQLFNLLALYVKFGIELYSTVIYPVFLCTIMGLTILKMIRWASYKRL